MVGSLSETLKGTHSNEIYRIPNFSLPFLMTGLRKEYSVHTGHSILSFGQAVSCLIFVCPGPLLAPLIKLMIYLGADLPTPLQIGQVSLKLYLPNKKIYLSLAIGRTFFLALFTVLCFRALAELGWGPSLGHSVELFSYKIKTPASQYQWSTSKAAR